MWKNGRKLGLDKNQCNLVSMVLAEATDEGWEDDPIRYAKVALDGHQELTGFDTDQCVEAIAEDEAR